jgi:hypothetical protein
MLQQQLRESNHTKKQDLFSEVHHPLRNGYVSVEELVRDDSHNKLGLFQPLSSFPLRGSSTKRQDRIPYKLPTAHHNLGS